MIRSPGIAAFLLSALLFVPAFSQPPLEPDALLREHLWQQVRRLPPGKRPRVGLVLSGGAVRGLAHIGVLHVLEDAGFPVDYVAGVSMGAVVGALYSSGYGLPRMWDFGLSLRLGSGSNLSKIRLLSLILSDKLLSSEETERMLGETIGDRRFDQLPKPFACVAMDIRTGEKIVFRDGPVAPAVRASMNLPGIFEPVLYRHRYLVDGGVVDYIPVDVARLLGAEWIMASVTAGDFSTSVPSSVLGTLQQVIDIRGGLLARELRKEADVLLEPDVGRYRFYDVEHTETIMEKGVEAAKAGLLRAQEDLILKTLPRMLDGQELIR